MSAADTFAGLYRLAALRRAAEPVWDAIDAMVVPTYPRPVTLAEIAADPIGPNSGLGTYTNFVNLLDLCALAVPGPFRTRRACRPGMTLIAPAGLDAALVADIGRADFHAAQRRSRMGATGATLPATEGTATATAATPGVATSMAAQDVRSRSAWWAPTCRGSPLNARSSRCAWCPLHPKRSADDGPGLPHSMRCPAAARAAAWAGAGRGRAPATRSRRRSGPWPAGRLRTLCRRHSRRRLALARCDLPTAPRRRGSSARRRGRARGRPTFRGFGGWRHVFSKRGRR